MNGGRKKKEEAYKKLSELLNDLGIKPEPLKKPTIKSNLKTRKGHKQKPKKHGKG